MNEKRDYTIRLPYFVLLLIFHFPLSVAKFKWTECPCNEMCRLFGFSHFKNAKKFTKFNIYLKLIQFSTRWCYRCLQTHAITNCVRIPLAQCRSKNLHFIKMSKSGVISRMTLRYKFKPFIWIFLQSDNLTMYRIWCARDPRLIVTLQQSSLLRRRQQQQQHKKYINSISSLSHAHLESLKESHSVHQRNSIILDRHGFKYLWSVGFAKCLLKLNAWENIWM